MGGNFCLRPHVRFTREKSKKHLLLFGVTKNHDSKNSSFLKFDLLNFKARKKVILTENNNNSHAALEGYFDWTPCRLRRRRPFDLFPR